MTPGVKAHAGADRGAEPFRDKQDFPWFWVELGKDESPPVDFAGREDFKGKRYNDFHFTRAFKEAARQAKGVGL